MASITLTGTLLDPTGEVAVGDQIRFTHRTTTGETIQFARSVLIIPPNGLYNITLEFGLIFVEYLDVKDVHYKNLGVVTVNGDTTATDLPGLLNAIVPPTDAQLLLFQGILADTEDARDIALLAAAQQTTLELIASTTTHPNSTVLTLSGHTLPGDGGGGKWQLNGTVGQTPSQSPTQLADFLLNDGNGNQWALVDGVVLAFNAVQYLPLPFGATGNGNYAYNDNDFDKIVDPDRLNPATLAIALGDTSLQLDDALNLKERTTGKGGGAIWDVFAAGTFTVSAAIFDVFDHDTLPLQLKLRPKAFASLREYGCVDGAVVDAVLPWQAASNSGLPVLLDGKFLLKSRVSEMHSLIGVDRELSELVIDGTFTDSVVFLNARHYTLFHNFLISMRNSPQTNIIAIHNFDGRHSDLHAITIRGNLIDGIGVLTEKGDATAFTFGHQVRNCNIAGQKICLSYTDTVTGSSIIDSDLVGVQSGGAPVIAGSRAIEIFPTSGNGFDILSNVIEGWVQGIYSEGTYLKITNNRFETNTTHIKLVRGEDNGKIWSSILDNKYLGTGVVDFPENNTDFVTRFEELGMRITTVIPVVGGGQDYHGSGTALTQTRRGAFPSGAESGDFIRVGTFSLKAMFQQATLRGTIAVLRTGVTQRGELDFKLNVFQDVAMSSTPGGTLTQWGDRISGNKIFAVVTLLNANTTDVEIWVQTGDNASQVIYEISSVSSLSNYLPDNTGTFQAALPAGPQIGPGVFRVFDNLAIDNIPTASGGLVSGTIWSNGGVLNIIP